MIKLAIPLLHVSDTAAAESFYCGQLGFKNEFAHRPDGITSYLCYLGVSRDGDWLHLSSFSNGGVAGGVANLVVDNVDRPRRICRPRHFDRRSARRSNLGQP
jgi:putative hemolysin